MPTIAVSGADNTGKTTQIRLLTRRIGPAATSAGPLDDHDPRWSAIKAANMTAWWFDTAPVEELTDVLAASYLTRAATVAASGLCFLDRGIPMLDAVLAATIAVREDLDHDRAADRARHLLTPYRADLDRAEADEHGIVLLHHNDPDQAVTLALARETTTTSVYAAYQRHLDTQIRSLVAAGRFAHVITTADRPVIAVQNQLRSHLRTVIPGIPAPAFDTVRVTALGGLSESGKSSAGQYLAARHGFARLKIGWLIEEAAARIGITDPYQQAPITRAELITDSLDRYCAAHHFVRDVSIESLHDYDSTAALRLILSERLHVIYLDAAEATRQRRSTTGPDDVTDRDTVKTSRGAEKIAEIADTIVDNNHSRLHLERALDRHALTHRWHQHRLATIPVNSLGLPVRLETYLSELVDQLTAHPPIIDMIAVTGSGARGKYQAGWSDLDVFVIADHTQMPLMRQTLAALESGLEGVKLGLTVLSRDECLTGAVTSRLLHILAMLGNGSVMPLWCHPGLTLPTPDHAADVDASVRDGIQAAIEIRRQLLRGAPEVRALYKVTALLAKIMLRFDGVEMSSDDEALAAFLTHHGGQDGRLAREARTNRDQAQALAALVLDTWMDTLTPAGAAA